MNKEQVKEYISDLLKEDYVVRNFLNGLTENSLSDNSKGLHNITKSMFNSDDSSIATMIKIHSEFMRLLMETQPDLLNYIDEICSDMFYNCNWLKDITIPNNIKNIWSDAFTSTGIKEIIIPKSIETISSPFCFCSNLKSIKFEDGSKCLYLFNLFINHCSNLIYLELPSSLTNIDTHIISNCNSLKEITFKGTKDQWDKLTYAKSWFWNSPIEVVHCSDGDIKL